RVDDRRTGFHVLWTELVDDRGSGRDYVADRLPADALLEFRDQIGGETFGECREGAIEHDAHQLPVAGHRILAFRSLGQAAVGRGRRCDGRDVLEIDEPRQAHRGKGWNVE